VVNKGQFLEAQGGLLGKGETAKVEVRSLALLSNTYSDVFRPDRVHLRMVAAEQRGVHLAKCNKMVPVCPGGNPS